MAKEVEKVAGIPVETVTEMDRIAKEYALVIDDGLAASKFAPALRMAEGMVKLQRLLEGDALKSVMLLQGSRLGFRTDKKPGETYPPMVVRDCVIEAVLRGFALVGNEFNIIAGNFYGTREGFERAVKELPGLTDLDVQPRLAAADMKDGATIDVGYTATWKLDGAQQQIEGSIPIRVNKYQGADAVLGKAWRKVLARVHKKVTGSAHTLPEGDVGDVDLPDAGPPAGQEGSVLTRGRHSARKSAKPAAYITGAEAAAEALVGAPAGERGGAPADGPEGDTEWFGKEEKPAEKT